MVEEGSEFRVGCDGFKFRGTTQDPKPKTCDPDHPRPVDLKLRASFLRLSVKGLELRAYRV